jgi:hypothetical protein
MSYSDEMAKFDTGKLAGARTDRGWNQSTASGFPFWCGDPRAEDIRIEDIASHLARICRFGGAIRSDIEIYSVAQHCCLVSDHCPPHLRLEGLLHDAAEAYTGDMIKPIKLLLGDKVKAIESAVDGAIRGKFGLPLFLTPEVKHQDYLAVTTEHRDVQIDRGAVDWGSLPQPWPEKIRPWGVFQAQDEFLWRFHRLYLNRGV